MAKETLQNPLVLYRHHGYGEIEKIHPIINRYKTEEDYKQAVHYNMVHRPLHALFSDTEVLNPGTLTAKQANKVLALIKKGKFKDNIPQETADVSKLYSH